MELERALGCLSRLRRHRQVIVNLNRFYWDGLADGRDAAIDDGRKGIPIERDFAPCQGATQCAVHSARDRGDDMVEGRGNGWSFLGSVVLAESSLDSIDNGVRHVAEGCVAVAF